MQAIWIEMPAKKANIVCNKIILLIFNAKEQGRLRDLRKLREKLQSKAPKSKIQNLKSKMVLAILDKMAWQMLASKQNS